MLSTPMRISLPDLISIFTKSKHAYGESYSTLRGLKSLRRMVDALSSVITDDITSLEKEMLPASRYYDINSLPCETMGNIMDLVAEATSTCPADFKRCCGPFSKSLLSRRTSRRRRVCSSDGRSSIQRTSDFSRYRNCRRTSPGSASQSRVRPPYVKYGSVSTGVRTSNPWTSIAISTTKRLPRQKLSSELCGCHIYTLSLS